MKSNGWCQKTIDNIKGLDSIDWLKISITVLMLIGAIFSPYIFYHIKFNNAYAGSDTNAIYIFVGRVWLVASFFLTIAVSWIYYLAESGKEKISVTFIGLLFIFHLLLFGFSLIILMLNALNINLIWNLLAFTVAFLITLVDREFGKKKNAFKAIYYKLDIPIIAAIVIVTVSTFFWEYPIYPIDFIHGKPSFLAGFSAGANAVIIVVGNLCFSPEK